jgi:hypothetical protein
MMVAAKQMAHLIDLKGIDTNFGMQICRYWLDYWPDLGRLWQFYDWGNCFTL